MSLTGVSIVYTVVTVGVGRILVLVPRFGRRGLLFGVYVGEDAHDSGPARDLHRRWTLWTTLVVLISVVAAIATGPLGLGEFSRLAPFLLLLGFCTTFTWAHRVARAMAVESHAPAVAVLEPAERHRLFPVLTLALVLLVGVTVLTNSIVAYVDLPQRIPTEFDESGRPTRWIEKSIGAVLMLPSMALVFGGLMAWMAVLLTGAKRSLRHPQTAVSVNAQNRFRTAISRYLSGIALLVTLILALMSLGVIESARGRPNSLLVLGVAVAGAMGLYAIGGVIYLLNRYGQGGTRLEEEAASPTLGTGELTNGLADNRLWKLGVFHVNHDDPSIFVEKRFGLGYTINFANPKAVGLMVGLLIFVAVVLIVSLSGI